MWKIFNVKMSFEALLKTDALMLQEQNENTQARPYISNTLERKKQTKHMTGAYSSWTIMVLDRGKNMY